MIHKDKYPERSQAHNGDPVDEPLFSWELSDCEENQQETKHVLRILAKQKENFEKLKIEEEYYVF